MKISWSLIIAIVVGVIASRTLLFQEGYFRMHDDLQIMRQFSMEKCFLDLQIPCRWIPDMGYGYGFPLFNFYPPLPYLVGEVFRLVGFSFVVTAKLAFAVSIIASGIAMYFLSKEFFGKLGGILSAAFYVWAPYHSVDVYVRGAMNESWALIFFPLILLFSYKLIKTKKGIIPLALSYAGLLLSHNLMVMIFTPVTALWCLLWLKGEKDWINAIKKLLVSGALALGLAAFFTIPAVTENKFTWLESQLVGYYDYTAHFVSLPQLLLTRFWGYGPSVWVDAEDGMSFQIGHIHWILSILIGLWWVLTNFKKRKKLTSSDYIIPFLLFVGWGASFMTHVRSTPIYQTFGFLALVQFPWRFLTIIIFAFSFLAGSITKIFEKYKTKHTTVLSLILILAVISFNWIYFLPYDGKMGKLTDEEKLTGVAWDLQQTAGIYDYLPLTAKQAPRAPQLELAEIIEGTGEITDVKEGTNWGQFKFKGEDSKVRINLFYFPGWKVLIDGSPVKVTIPEDEIWGRMWIDIPSGEHFISARFGNTPVRTFSNIVSLFSWMFLAFLGVKRLKLRRSAR